MQLSELDIFKLSDKSPIHLKDLPQASKAMYKVWSGLTKFIRSALQQQKSPSCPEIGKFIPTSPIKFIPSVQFLTTLKALSKLTSDSNPSAAYKDQQISYTSIAEVSSLSRDTVILCIKELLAQVYQQISQGTSVNLNVKIGVILITRSWVDFTQSTAGERLETTSYLSVNTPRSSRCTVISEAPSFHPSNPNPLHQGASVNVNNYYRGIKYKTDNSLLAPVAFYTGQIHPILNFRTRFTRKQAFEQPLSPENLLKYHQEQIEDKKRFKELERLQESNDAQKTLKDFKELTKVEKLTKVATELERRKKVAHANLERSYDRAFKEKLDNEAKRAEVYDYFPFTHGDEVEQRQKAMNLSYRDELQKHLKSIEGSPINSSRDPVVAVPKFLQSSEYSNIRRTQNAHVEKVMKGALDQYHLELQSKEKAKVRLLREKEAQEMQDALYYKQLESIRRKELDDNLSYLNDQVENKKKKALEESEVKKNVYRTSLELVNETKEQAEQRLTDYLNNQRYLAKQIESNDNKHKEEFLKERDIDQKILNNVELALNQEDAEAKVRENYTKNLNKGIWLKQMEIKELEKDVGKIL